MLKKISGSRAPGCTYRADKNSNIKAIVTETMILLNYIAVYQEPWHS